MNYHKPEQKLHPKSVLCVYLGCDITSVTFVILAVSPIQSERKTGHLAAVNVFLYSSCHSLLLNLLLLSQYSDLYGVWYKCLNLEQGVYISGLEHNVKLKFSM